MAEESGSLICDDDETCEKNTSESDEDGEEYVSAPLGNLRIALFLFIRWLQPFPLSFFPPAFVALLCCYIVHFYQPASWETFLLQCHVRFFDFEFYLLLFFLCRQTWAVRTMASSQTIEFYTDRHPASGRSSGKIFFSFQHALTDGALSLSGILLVYYLSFLFFSPLS